MLVPFSAAAETTSPDRGPPVPQPTSQAVEPPPKRPFNPDADPDIAMALRLGRAFHKVADHVKPTVVSLSVYTSGGAWSEEVRRMHEQGGPLSPERKFTGSGVVVEDSGVILTNEHVVRDAEKIRVTLADKSVFQARVIGTDARSDLAVLKPVKPLKKKLQAVALADSDEVNVGEFALALGNPFELANTLTVGVVSARGRSLPNRSYHLDVFYGNLIQTDAAINPGNSGGPLFNLRGELIGINTMIFSRSGKSEGFGFAIPTNDIRPRLAYLAQGRPVEYGWLGVRLRDLEPEQTAFKVPPNGGVLVEDVLANMPADRAGMQRGSVILAFDGMPVASTNELIRAVGQAPVGKVSKVRMLNTRGEVVELNVRLGKRSPDLVRLANQVHPGGEDDPPRADEFDWRGMRVRELPAADAEKAGGRLQVMRVLKGTAADRAGLYEGAILDEVKYAEKAAIQPLKRLDDLREAARSTKSAVYLHSPIVGYVSLDAE